MTLHITCLYCGREWQQYAYSGETFFKCPKCTETHLIKVQKISETKHDIFGYNSSPPFPTKPTPNDSY